MALDYSGQNLRGRSFKGQNLTGANFSKADIRGANFTNAILKGANFCGAKAGLQRRSVIGLLIVVFLLSALAGVGVAVPFVGGEFLSLVGGLAIAGTGAIALVGALVAGLAIAGTGAVAYHVAQAFFGTEVGIGVGAIAIILILFNAYRAWPGLSNNERYIWNRSFAIAFAATGGTSFHNADLTYANFTEASLKNTNLSTAKLIRTRFYKAKKLDFARLGNTILSNRSVLNLLITLNGRYKSYFGANLRDANLIGADLTAANLENADMMGATFQGACLEGANLKNADMMGATFQGAYLEGANLTLTQAVGTNFSNAQMTGACVEAWNIESTTKLDNVDCRFVYLLEYPKPETDDRERRPSSEEFQPGEFTKLFEQVLKTVDLIFRDGIDRKAFMTAFKKVQVENGDTELDIQSIENKGDGVLLVKVAFPDNANKEKIHRDFFEEYQLALEEAEKYKELLLESKNDQIEDNKQKYSELSNITKLLASQQTSIEQHITQESKQMNNSNDYSRNVKAGRDINASGQALNLGEISGTVTNTINELPSAPESEKPGIKELLIQLQTAIKADSDLSEEDKVDALEQVKTLAEAGKNPQEGGMQKMAKTAIKILKGTIAGLPSATKLVEEFGKLLPLISNFLGLE